MQRRGQTRGCLTRHGRGPPRHPRAYRQSQGARTTCRSSPLPQFHIPPGARISYPAWVTPRRPEPQPAMTRLSAMFEEGLAELHTHLGASVASAIMWSLAHEQGISLPVKDYWEFDRLVTIADPRRVDSLDALDQ